MRGAERCGSIDPHDLRRPNHLWMKPMNASDYAILLMPVGLALLGAFALRFGADSRTSWCGPKEAPVGQTLDNVGRLSSACPP